MTKVGKVIVLFAITTMALTLPLAAQFVQDKTASLESNTKRATAGVFSNSVDDFIDTRNWKGVSFDNWFGFATGNSATGTDLFASGTSDRAINKASLGYARKFGGLYLGAWYNGNILQMKGNSSPTITKEIVGQDDDDAHTQTQTVTTTTYNDAYTNYTNQLQLLFGVGSMGFKVGFFESLAQNKNPAASGRPYTVTDSMDGFIDYQNETVDYSQFGGHLRPTLSWGATFTGAVTIKPFIDLGFDMYQDESIDNYISQYTTHNGRAIGSEQTSYSGWNNGKLEPDAAAGADIVIPGETVTSTIGVKYNLNIWFYNNSYDAAGISDTAKGLVNWYGGTTIVNRTLEKNVTTTNMTLSYKDPTYWKHVATPSYKITGEPVSGFKLGVKVTVPVELILETEDSYQEQHQINKTVFNNNVNKSQNTTYTSVTRYNNGLDETTTITVKPVIGLGASYKLIPNRFTVNAGIEALPLSYTNKVKKSSPNGVNSTTTTKTVDGNGVTINESVQVSPNYSADTLEITETWDQFAGAVKAGFVFEFTPQLFLDLYAGTTVNFDVNVSTVNVLFGFKF